MLAVLNITSWSGQCAGAIHLYGHLIIVKNEEITIDTVDDWCVMGEKIELERDMSLDEAKALDIRDQSGGLYQKRWLRGSKDTNRFNTFDEVVESGVAKWKELDLDCDFISLYEGEKYKSNSYNSATTVILKYGETIPI